LKLLIFGGQLVAAENNHGTFLVAFIFDGQVTAAENKLLFSAIFFWRPETAENRPKAAKNKLFSAA
jgi:hypothetical protein